MKVDEKDVVYDQSIYPRASIDRETISIYQDSIEMLPGIVVDRNYRIIDGYHRLQAHRAEGITEIEVEVLDIEDDLECLIESIRRNSTHGRPLSKVEKKNLAIRLYESGVPDDDIRGIVGISDRRLRDYLKDLKSAEKEDRDQKILDMWLSCYTEQEIADTVKVDQATVNRTIKGIMQNGKIAEMHKEPPVSLQVKNLWEFGACDQQYGTKGYPGRMPGQIVENLIWYYTDPFDLVLDPMAGGGTTLDVCRRYYRRCLGYDLNPIEPKGIRRHDITEGLPAIPIKATPRLIILDPPYAGQRKGEYTKRSSDMSNMKVPDFYKAIRNLAGCCFDALDETGRVAFTISAMKKSGYVYDLAFECTKEFESKGFELEERVIIPYGNEASAGFYMSDAREKKEMLRAYRDLMILRKAT